MTVHVLLPRTGIRIDRGSGVVADIDPDVAPTERIDVWFEGNRHNAVNLQRWADRVHCAADRMLTNYPTVARTSGNADDYTVLATYDPATGQFDWLHSDWADLLANWLGHSLSEDDVRTTVSAHQMR